MSAPQFRRVVESDREELIRNDLRAFGSSSPLEGALEGWARHVEWDRFWLAADRGDQVGAGGAFTQKLTVPVGDGSNRCSTVHCAGVTWVSVQSTHRRLGIMRGLLDRLGDDARERGEPVMALFASEGAIYSKVGFGPASEQRAVSVDARRARFRSDAPTGGRCRFAEVEEARPDLEAIFGEFRSGQPGEVTRSDIHWDRCLADEPAERDGGSRMQVLTHLNDDDQPDGYARYRQHDSWGSGDPAHRIELIELIANTAAAHAELWRVLLATDLVSTIDAHRFAVDDPLQWILDDARAVATNGMWDGIWLKVLDLGAMLEARELPTDLFSRVEISSGDVGTLVLGGRSAKSLAMAGRLAERNAGAAADLDRHLRSCRAPFCTTGF